MNQNEPPRITIRFPDGALCEVWPTYPVVFNGAATDISRLPIGGMGEVVGHPGVWVEVIRHAGLD